MRRRAAVVVAGACLLSLLNPSPAFAIFGGGWLERLSGPGPFWGQIYEPRFLCVSLPNPGGPRVTSDPKLEWLAKKLNDQVWVTAAAGCHMFNRDQPNLQIGAEFGTFGSDENVLDYRHRPDLTADDTKVGLRTFLITADLRVNRVVDVGAAIGGGWFRPAGAREDLFEGFRRLTVQPLRVRMRPLAVVADRTIADLLVLRADATKFNGGFTAADFGASPGSYNEPGEIVWGWSVIVDLTTFLWRKH